MFYKHFMIKTTCQCSKKLVWASLHKKWHCIFKHLLISYDDTILIASQNDDAIQSYKCISHDRGVYSISVKHLLDVMYVPQPMLLPLSAIYYTELSFSIYYRNLKFCNKFLSWKVRCGHLVTRQKIIITTIN